MPSELHRGSPSTSGDINTVVIVERNLLQSRYEPGLIVFWLVEVQSVSRLFSGQFLR